MDVCTSRARNGLSSSCTATATLLSASRGLAAHLAEKDINNQRSKHIDTRFHFIRDWVQSKAIEIIKVHTTLNVADLFTKALPKATLLTHTSAFLTAQT